MAGKQGPLNALFKDIEPTSGWSTYLTPADGLIEQPHDYSEIDADEVYTRSKSAYGQKVRLISNRRLELSCVPTKSIDQFLPSRPRRRNTARVNKNHNRRRMGIRRQTREKGRLYLSLRNGSLVPTSRGNEATKELRRIPKCCGPFFRCGKRLLEPCYLMFDQLISAGHSAVSIHSIPPQTQTDILFKYSEEFFLSKPLIIRKDLPTQEWAHVDSLVSLINSLGQLFYDKLHDPTSREARVFSFTIRGRPSPEVQKALDIGVRYHYFQLRTYSSKEGGGREFWYVLNRRLCPVLVLDPSGFEGE